MTSVGPTGGPPPGPPTYGAPPPPVTTTVVMTQPTNVAQPGGTCHYRDAPCLIQCQFCGAVVTTATTYVVGTLPIVVGLILVLVGCYLGCCLIPCCLNSMKDVVHNCPNCQQRVGRFNRI